MVGPCAEFGHVDVEGDGALQPTTVLNPTAMNCGALGNAEESDALIRNATASVLQRFVREPNHAVELCSAAIGTAEPRAAVRRVRADPVRPRTPAPHHGDDVQFTRRMSMPARR
jgi:hypothetical protein